MLLARLFPALTFRGPYFVSFAVQNIAPQYCHHGLLVDLHKKINPVVHYKNACIHRVSAVLFFVAICLVFFFFFFSLCSCSVPYYVFDPNSCAALTLCVCVASLCWRLIWSCCCCCRSRLFSISFWNYFCIVAFDYRISPLHSSHILWWFALFFRFFSANAVAVTIIFFLFCHQHIFWPYKLLCAALDSSATLWLCSIFFSSLSFAYSRWFVCFIYAMQVQT